MALPDFSFGFKMASKQTEEGDYSRKLIFYSMEQLFYCYKELRLKTSRKERSNQRLSLLGSIVRIPELFDKKFEQRTFAFSLAFFTALDLTEYWGTNDKGVGVSVFTNCTIRTTKKRNTPE